MKPGATSETQAMDQGTILVVDDERSIREILCDFLELEGFSVTAVENALIALTELRKKPFDILLTDLKLPEIDGIELMQQARILHPDLIILMMTGYGTIETAIDAMKNGAYDYVLKPFKVPDLVFSLKRGLEKKNLENKNRQLNQLVALYEITEKINTSLKLDKVLDIFIEAAFRNTGADYADVYLLNYDGDFELSVRKNKNGPFVPNFSTAFNIKKLLNNFQENIPVLCNEQWEIHPFFTGYSEEVGSLMAVPLVCNSNLAGFISIVSMKKSTNFSEEQRKSLYILASKVAQSVENAKLYKDLEDTFKKTMESFAIAMEQKDRYTQGHSERVAKYAFMIGETIGLDQNDIDTVFRAALLHDIGKLGIDTDKINKVGELDPEEVRMFRRHPENARRILEPLSSLSDMVSIIYHHHERYNGSGYPDGLIGEAIPLGARILSVADAFDAMTSDRSYRKARSFEIALSELIKNIDIQFDKVVVDAFAHALKRNKLISSQTDREGVL